VTIDTEPPCKEESAAAISAKMRQHAFPDSRFQHDISKFIPGFDGSDVAAQGVIQELAYRRAQYLFVTPDNALIPFRQCAVRDGKTMVLPSYGLHRGFLLLDPKKVPRGHEKYAAWLDGVEHFGYSVTLGELQRRGRFDLVVLGASAVNAAGLRFGMGHRYLDIEWGIFAQIGVVDDDVPIATIIHDTQYTTAKLPIESSDILVDIIATPTGIWRTPSRPRPSTLNWALVDSAIEDSPPLRELRESGLNGTQRPSVLLEGFQAKWKRAFPYDSNVECSTGRCFWPKATPVRRSRESAASIYTRAGHRITWRRQPKKSPKHR
jgi:5-formyltetrahydrofolate cyclo-ligase